MKITLSSFFGDLASCFDRMKTSLSSIVSMQKGIPKSVCISRSRTVCNMEMHIRTAAGISKTTYTENPGEYKINGEMQGLGSIMCLWMLISELILHAHKRDCHVVTLKHLANATASH